MDGTTPLLSPNVPRFAPPRGHTRTPSRSPTRHRLADDILSDLSPATTLEAFTNPSGKLKASIEAATPSERAFGLRATLASKKIQEWVDELSGWPWPAEGGSLGFEIPSAKRRKLSLQPDDRGRRNSNGYTQEPKYIGSLLETEVDRYENRIDDITADMEDLNVEEIKRQVLDTHFSPRSRPSSSASNAPPMPSLFASYTRMDDFTAVITATVLHSLPNLSRLTRLMDVWNIRLSVLRKVPPLMTALDDAEIALKSGWTAIDTQDTTTPDGDPYLSRKTFEVMRDVLQNKVTTLGQDLDYMLDTLEGRQDTLPDIWLDRMETIENDYGSWVVSGDRKVREGEWARMAKARKEEDDTRKLKEAEAAETARRKVEEEARRRAQLEAEDAEAARLKLEQEAKETARLQAEEAEGAAIAGRKVDEDAKKEAARLEALMKVEELKMEKLLAEQKLEAETARLKAEEIEAREIAKHKALKEAEEIEAARLLAEQQAESARLAEEDARELAQQKALLEAKHAEEARLLAEREAEIATLQAEKEAQEVAHRKALDEAAQLEATRLLAEQQAKAEFTRLQAQEHQDAQEQAFRDAEIAEAARVADLEVQEVARQQALREAQEAEEAELLAQQAEESERQATVDLAILQAECDAEAAAMRKAKLDAESAESRERDETELARQTAEQEAVKQAQLGVEATTLTSNQDTDDIESARQSEVNRTTEVFQQEAEPGAEASGTKARQSSAFAESARMKLTRMEVTADELVNERISDCDICEEIRQSKPNSPSQPVMGAAVSSGAARTKSFVDSLVTTDFDDAIEPQITRYAPFDGGYESSEPAIRTTEVEIKKGSNILDLASPIHLDDSFPQTPTSSTLSSAARVYTSPTSEESSPPGSKVLPFGHGFASIVRVSSPVQEDRVFQATEEQSEPVDKATPAPQTPVRSVFSFDGANDVNTSDQAKSRTTDEEWVVVDSPGDTNTELPANVQDHHSDPESTNPRSSVVLEYSTSEPTPEIYEAQPAEYFASPTKTQLSSSDTDFTPPRPLPVTPKPLTLPDVQITTPKQSPMLLSNRHSRESTNSILSPVAEEFMSRSTELDVDGSCDACEVAVRDLESSEKEFNKETALPALAHKTSISRIDSPVRRISIPRRESISSDASTIIHGRFNGSPSSTVASPISEDATESSMEQSPSAGRIGHRSVKSYDISPPNSPPPGIAKRPSLFLPTTPSFSASTAPSTPLADSTPQTPLDAPVFDNVDVSTVPIIASPKKSNSDDQMQQQISSLLESIPARIRLTTESDSTPFSSQTLRPKKTRRSITPSFRSSSSMSNYSTSSRAPTPSFTLAPAFGKTSSRPRPQSSNPEIKLYHLSRSNSDAPIKLFVRLVGEHGERVMVRVGGGWADLGEYLKEYASHHGRRSGIETGDKVQIQDLPSRNVSSSSTVTLRGNANGRSTPDPRPQSVMERERPASSLFVRKTRRSVGGESSSSSTTTTSASTSDQSLAPRLSDVQSRAPSTPLPSTSLHRTNIISTPPSTTSSTSVSTQGDRDRDRDRQPRSSSRLSWTSDDTSLPLGLAGPKSKNITISERDQEWVESMKEKVRLASAEKEKRERDSGVGLNMGMGTGMRGKGEGSGGSGRESRASFGEMEKVGGTKRLFRKGL